MYSLIKLYRKGSEQVVGYVPTISMGRRIMCQPRINSNNFVYVFRKVKE